MPRYNPISGPIFELQTGSGHIISFCDGELVGDRPTVEEIKRRLAEAGVTEPRFQDVCAVAQAIHDDPAPIKIAKEEELKNV